MLHSKRRQSKLKKLQDMRRSYIEQLAFIRQFRKDDDGGLIVLTLLLLISMLVVGGMAVDFMRFESERTRLQSVSDRAVLAAANLNQNRDAATVITDFFQAEGYGNAIVGTPDIDKNANGSTITINSRVDVDTFYLRLVGMDTLTAPATASAIEGTGNVEVSLILDISGSMGRTMTGPVNQVDADGNYVRNADGDIVTVDETHNRMFFLKQAANKFLEDLLLPEYEDRISINLIAYSQHVALGDDLYTALKTSPDSIREDGQFGSTFGSITDGYAAPFNYTWVNADGDPVSPDDPDGSLVGPYDVPVDLTWAEDQEVVTNPSRCVLFEDDEYDTLTFDVDRVYDQVEHVDFYSSGTNFYWEPCAPEDFQGIVLMSQDLDVLQGAISQYVPTVNTSIHRGMKWGVSLLDPSMRNLIDGIPTVDDAFRGTRPADYNDSTTTKYVVIMTDGQTVSSRRLKRAAYGDTGANDHYDSFDEWKGFSDYTGRYYAENDGNDATTFWTMTESIGSTTDLNTKLDQLCTLAAEDDKMVVYTISMGIQNETMTNCASDTANAFMTTITNDPDEPGLQDIFDTIASQITALRLSL